MCFLCLLSSRLFPGTSPSTAYPTISPPPRPSSGRKTLGQEYTDILPVDGYTHTSSVSTKCSCFSASVLLCFCASVLLCFCASVLLCFCACLPTACGHRRMRPPSVGRRVCLLILQVDTHTHTNTHTRNHTRPHTPVPPLVCPGGGPVRVWRAGGECPGLAHPTRPVEGDAPRRQGLQQGITIA